MRRSGRSSDDSPIVLYEPSEAPQPPVDDSIVEITPEPSVLEIEVIPGPSGKNQNITRGAQLLDYTSAVPGPSGVRAKSNNQHQHRMLTNHRKGKMLPPTSTKTFMFGCEHCKKKFSDPGKFQTHAERHDTGLAAGAGAVKLMCLVCSWAVTDVKVAQHVTRHLSSHQHSINTAKKISQIM